MLKPKGLDVLRALLRRFYSYRDGTCFPSYDAIAEAAGCARSTVATKLRILEQLGIVETIRRKIVASFTSRAHRVRFDVAVQTSNSYRFNLPITDRPAHGDFGLPLLQPKEEAESSRPGAGGHGTARMTPVAPDPAAVDPFEVARVELVEALVRMVSRVIQHGKAEAQSALGSIEANAFAEPSAML